NTVILHWDECQMSWAELSWRDWVRFRGCGTGRQSLLVGAKAGEHYFLVCVLGHCGELSNVIPHKYVLSADARLVHGFDGLEETEPRNCAELTLFAPPRLKSPSVTMSSTHGVSRSTCRLHIPSSPCCGRCLVSRVPSPALRAGSFFLLL